MHHLLPITVAAVAAFLIGGLWYSPLLFAKAWQKAHGYTPEKVASMQATAARAYAISFVCLLVMAFVLHLLVARLGATSAVAGANWGFHVWLGFAATIGLMANVYSDKPLAAYLIDAGYQLVYLVAMGAILGGWQ